MPSVQVYEFRGESGSGMETDSWKGGQLRLRFKWFKRMKWNKNTETREKVTQYQLVICWKDITRERSRFNV